MISNPYIAGANTEEPQFAFSPNLDSCSEFSIVNKVLGKRIDVKAFETPCLSGFALQDPCILTNPRKSSRRDVEVVYEEAL